MGNKWAFIALATLFGVLVLNSGAADDSGQFKLNGPFIFPPETEVTLQPIAGIVNDTDAISTLDLKATEVRLCVYELQFLYVGASDPILRKQQGKPVETCSDLAEVKMKLAPGDHRGYLAVHSCTHTAAILGARSQLDGEVRDYSTLASRERKTAASQEAIRDDHPDFSDEVQGDHLLLKVTGTASFGDGCRVKFRGPDVQVASSTNTTFYRTGKFGSKDPLGPTVTLRWITLDYAKGVLVVESEEAPIVMAATTAQEVRFNGNATFSLKSLQAQGLEPAAQSSQQFTITGRFDASLTPLGYNWYLLDLRAPSAMHLDQGSQLAAWTMRGSANALLLGVGSVLLLGVGIVVGAKQKRAHLEPPRAQVLAAARTEMKQVSDAPALVVVDFESLAEDAADGQEWDRAAELLARARRAQPERGDLANRQGMCLLKAGRLQEALLAFDEASYLLKDGSPERMAAICAVRLRFPEKAHYFLLRALDRTPHIRLVDEIEEDPEFLEALSDAEVERAIVDARRRLSK